MRVGPKGRRQFQQISYDEDLAERKIRNAGPDIMGQVRLPAIMNH